jgi:ribosomal protein L37AE/L43A
MEWLTATPEQRMNEAGSEPPCPFCGRPRVKRSTYIRCNPCGKNWVEGTDIFKHPHTKGTRPTSPETGDTAQTAVSTSEAR